MTKFRFQDMEIWKEAIQIGNVLYDVADKLEEKKLFRFAEQLRGAGMSMSNNIAEGSGSNSKKEFHQFLNIARRSTFENANILIVLQKRDLIANDMLDPKNAFGFYFSGANARFEPKTRKRWLDKTEHTVLSM